MSDEHDEVARSQPLWRCAVPRPGPSPGDREETEWWLEREVGMLQRALEDKGEMRRRELGQVVGCKYWGPGRFSGALKAAVDQGAIEHTGFGRYGPKRRD